MDPSAMDEFRQLELEKNRLEADIKNLYDYLTDDGRLDRDACNLLACGMCAHFLSRFSPKS